MDELPNCIATVEELVARQPDSASLRRDVLLEYLAFPALSGDPRRLAHIRWCAEHSPREPMCRSPMVRVDPDLCPDAFADIEGIWRKHLGSSPEDADIVIGAAYHQYAADPERGTATVRAYLQEHPNAARVWFELGRFTLHAAERLAAFVRADALGFDNQNLVCWIALEAAKAGVRALALEAANRLQERNRRLRDEFGEKLDWTGRDLWKRVRAASRDDQRARVIVNAIHTHAHARHHAHTALGLIACLDGRADEAAEHLKASAEVGSDPGLSAYGPSLSLARKLCEHGKWEEVSSFLRRCAVFWDDARVPGWIEDLGRGVMPSEWQQEGEGNQGGAGP